MVYLTFELGDDKQMIDKTNKATCGNQIKGIRAKGLTAGHQGYFDSLRCRHRGEKAHSLDLVLVVLTLSFASIRLPQRRRIAHEQVRANLKS